MTPVRNETQRYSAVLKSAGQSLIGLLPLDGRGRLGGHVVHHAVHAVYLVDDAAGDLADHVVGQLRPVRGHGVGGLDDAHDDRALVGTLVSHDADALDVGQNREVLPAAVLAVAFASLLEQALVVGVQLFSHDGVRVLEDGELLWRYLADDADGETGAGGDIAKLRDKMTAAGADKVYEALHEQAIAFNELN